MLCYINLSDSRGIHRERSDSQSAMSNSQCLVEGSLSLEKVSELLGSNNFHKKSLWASQSNRSAREGSQIDISSTEKVMSVVSVCKFNSVQKAKIVII